MAVTTAKYNQPLVSFMVATVDPTNCSYPRPLQQQRISSTVCTQGVCVWISPTFRVRYCCSSRSRQLLVHLTIAFMDLTNCLDYIRDG